MGLLCPSFGGVSFAHLAKGVSTMFLHYKCNSLSSDLINHLRGDSLRLWKYLTLHHTYTDFIICS